MILTLNACTSDTEKELYGIWTVEDVTFSNSSLVTKYELAAFETTYKETVLKLNEDKTGMLRYIGKDYNTFLHCFFVILAVFGSLEAIYSCNIPY